jgi:general secretion pathway protein A
MTLLNYYGLNEQPFGVTPDPRFLFFSDGHREALASIYYAIEERRGFSALVAKPGMGKTTLLFRLLESLQESAKTAFLFQAGQDSRDFLDSLVRDLGIRTKSNDLPALHESLNALLVKEMEANRRVVVVIDEAQNLSEEMLEQVRLLSNFETPAAKMIHIVLAGQPGLADKLGNPALTQLRQRVGAVAQLPALTLEETKQYVEQRLRAAGYQGSGLFTTEALENITVISEGIPRNINSICFQALSLGFVYQKQQIGPEIVKEVARDLELKKKEVQPKVVPRNQKGAEPQRERSPRIPVAAPAAWPSFPPAVQAVDFGYYGMPHSAERRKSRTSFGVVAFLLIFLPLLTFAALTKTGVVNGNDVLDRFTSAVRHSRTSVPSTAANPQPTTSPDQKITETGNTSIPSSVPPSSANLPSVSPTPGVTHDDSKNTEAPSDQRSATPRVIRLTRKQTVNDLAAEYFGASDKSAVRLILSQNPKIRHAYQVLPAGTQLVLPAGATTEEGEHPDTNEQAQPDKQSAGTAPRSARKYGSVRVRRDETLFQFAMEELGRGDWATVGKIRAANPQIRDPYQILEKGQWIKLPEELAQR